MLQGERIKLRGWLLKMAVPFENLYNHVEMVLTSKIEEFRYCGYNAITQEELWTYCIEKKWRKKEIEQLHLYEIVATIYTVVASEVLSHMQIKDFRKNELSVEISIDELEQLLKPLPKDGYVLE